MKAYKTKASSIVGTGFKEVHKKALELYKQIKSQSKRRTYIKSAYFCKEKVFIDLFWQHLFEKKNWKDRIRRVRYFPSAIELIKKSRFEPTSKENPNRRSEILHRFAGTTKDNEVFFVQIKENKNTGQKFLISIFPLF